ncbi:RNA-guided pseudouridylation complex pseudouridine synthase subunit Cbf5 [Candidatus Pacearchaeota archaeon]|nr:RNA-guided pseudouridylation complex pseudouridine synthase subunit Cbf5 [Candidatus Pacearchaeota archaeon]
MNDSMLDIQVIKSKKSTEDLIRFSIINIDKPSGPTSFQVSQFVKNSLNVNKTSHFGTLDPAVSGVLPVGIGRACRLNEYLMHRDKTYVGIMRVHQEISESKLNKIVEKFIGKIQQLPPVRSRVKRAVREREIKYFNILEIDGKDILFETQVQAGTYIRKICDDMGKEIGGAHMLELRRTQAGLFSEKDIHTLYDFENALNKFKDGEDKILRSMLVPGEIVTTIMPTIEVRKDVVKKCLTGSPIFLSFLKDKDHVKNLIEEGKICIISEDKFIGCYKFIGKEDLVAKPEFVLN